MSIGVLVLMLSLAGQVLTLSVRSTGQAQALSDLNTRIRAFEQTLREDLRHVKPGRSLILIQGNPVNAYWTSHAKEVGQSSGDPLNGKWYPRDTLRADPRDINPTDADGQRWERPRADILMLFTTRRARSYVNPSVVSDAQQVVYGHAELGEWQPAPDNPGQYVFTLNAVEQGLETSFPAVPETPTPNKPDPRTIALFPASQWHLSRRSVLLLPSVTPTPPPKGYAAPPIPGVPVDLGQAEVLRGEKDIVAGFSLEAEVLQPNPAHIGNPAGQPGDAPWYLPRIFGNWELVPFARSRLDPTPPPARANTLGPHLLPNCASFKVEWALSSKGDAVNGLLDPEHDWFWVDPGEYNPSQPQESNPLVALEQAITEADDLTRSTDPLKRKLAVERMGRLNSLRTLRMGMPGGVFTLETRFRTDPDWRPSKPVYSARNRTNLHVFTASRRDPITGEIVPDDVFPAALRITIDMYDDANRLERPIRHVIVAPVGEN